MNGTLKLRILAMKGMIASLELAAEHDDKNAIRSASFALREQCNELMQDMRTDR